MSSIIDQAWLDAHPGALTQPKHVSRGRGYAAAPGTGPAGETCKSCAHYSGHRMSKIYRKCGLMRAFWTGGPGTDIKAKSPACKHWMEKIGGKTFAQIAAEEQHEKIMANLRAKAANQS